MKKNVLSSSLTFSLVSDWPEKCGKPAGSRVFPLFSSATSASSKNFFIEKIYLDEKANFHLIVKT